MSEFERFSEHPLNRGHFDDLTVEGLVRLEMGSKVNPTAPDLLNHFFDVAQCTLPDPDFSLHLWEIRNTV